MPKEIKKDEQPPQIPELGLLSRAVKVFEEELVKEGEGPKKPDETGANKPDKVR